MKIKPDATSHILDQRTPGGLRLILLTIQETKIPTHPNLRMTQNHHITLLLESDASEERTDGSDVIELIVMEYTNP